MSRLPWHRAYMHTLHWPLEARAQASQELRELAWQLDHEGNPGALADAAGERLDAALAAWLDGGDPAAVDCWLIASGMARFYVITVWMLHRATELRLLGLEAAVAEVRAAAGHSGDWGHGCQELARLAEEHQLDA